MRLIFSWAVLHSGSSTLSSSCSRYPLPTSPEFFLCYAHGFIRLRAACWKKRSFHNWFPSDKRSQAYHWNTPIFFFFFEKDTSSDLWEVAPCLSKLLWMMDDSIPIFPFAHRCWNCASLQLDTVGNGASKYFILISSHSIQDWLITSFSPPSRFDSMITSLSFGWLRVLSVLRARRDWSVRALDDVIRKRSFDHTFCLSEPQRVP